MTSLDATIIDFTPHPGAAPRSRRVVAHARTESRLLVRNGEQLLLALVIPVGILLAGRMLNGRFGMHEETIAPSVMALAIFSTCFTSLAIATGFERRYGVLERLAGTPLGRSGLLAGKALAIIAIAVAQLVILAVVAAVLGWRPHPDAAQWLVAVIGVPLAMLTFANLALAMAGRLRAEATLGLANLIYLIGITGGGIMWPVSAYPVALRWLVRALPTGALGEVGRAWSAGGTTWWALPVLIVWAAASGLLARKVFRWMS
ncbi:MAG: ABC transporter permease [Propionibacterium sp.]|nr:ABC transporter permease [Propionibacterium sp.]